MSGRFSFPHSADGFASGFARAGAVWIVVAAMTSVSACSGIVASNPGAQSAGGGAGIGSGTGGENSGGDPGTGTATGGAPEPGSGGSTGTGTGGRGTGGVRTGGATGTGTGGAAVSTCGNGRLDAGEDCEGSNLNGGTCTSIGFEGGTVSCSAGCRFDAKACTGMLKPTVVTSRATCAAPCGVYFDAMGTAGLMDSDYVAANFDWDFDSTNVDPNGTHERGRGFLGAHVFSVPGTYQVTVRVRDAAGRAGATTIPITITAMAGTTLYVSANGSDSAAGTMAAPMKTPATALGKVGAQGSVLLRRGDTFKATSLEMSGTGPLLLGAYADPASPSTVAPILSLSTADTAVGLSGQDMRVVDVHIVSTGRAGNGFLTGSNAVLQRVEIEGTGNIAFSVPTGASPVFIVDCHAHDFVGYGGFGDRITRFAMIGTTIQRFGGGQHGFRMQGGDRAVVVDNTVLSNDTDSAQSALTFRGNNGHLVVVGNRINRLLDFAPQNEVSDERVADVLAEGNVLNDPRRTASVFYTSLIIQAQHVVVRNNLFINPAIAVSVEGHPMLPTNFVDRISVYNNTSYYAPGGMDDVKFINQSRTTGSLVVRNNIFYTGSTIAAQSRFLENPASGTFTEDHNLSFAPNIKGTWGNQAKGTGSVVADPKFMSVDMNSGDAFKLSNGSGAIDIGASTPVYEDIAGAPRPTGAAADMGAYEYAQ